MPNKHFHSNIVQRLTHRFARSRAGSKLSSLVVHHIDGPILRATRGRVAPSSIFTGLPVVLITTTGAKSGQARTIPLVAIPDGTKVFVIASNWGGANYPAWYHNLRAHPRATITYGDKTQLYRAHEATGDEYERYWQYATELYKGYAEYKNRTNGRPIPIVVLEPEG